MPLGTREILLVVRARDQASRVLADVGRGFATMDAHARQAAQTHLRTGAALTGLGIVIGAAGAAATAFYVGAAREAAAYNKEASLTLTQIQGTGARLEDVKKIGLDVARAIPAPFKEMQKSLYDIFSSTNLSVAESERVLAAFSKGAVAGQTSVQTAGRATISIINGMGLEWTDLDRVMDVQFETVRTGVITYDEFANTIGRAIPSARNAGQSIEVLGGMIAFLTRNGLSAAMAATSAARALDLFANPKFAREMSEIGISVFDATGKFRPLPAVIGELTAKLGDMTQQEAAAALKELTKGAGGTIQAMRFMNTAVRDVDGTLKEYVDRMFKSAGAMEAAYGIMFRDPTVQMQLLKNNFDILQVVVGEAFLPVINELAQAGIRLIQIFTELPDGVQDTITKAGFAVAAFTLLTGAVVALSGALLVLRATLMATSVGFGQFVAAVAIFTAVAAAVGYLVSQEDLLAAATEIVGAAFNRARPFFESLRDIGGDLVSIFAAVVKQLAPLATIVAGLVVMSVIDFLNLFASGLKAVTGFLADHPILIQALVVWYGTRLVGALLAVTTALANMGIANAAFVLANLVLHAQHAIHYFGILGVTLRALPVLAAIGLIVQFANSLADAKREAQTFADSLTTGFDLTSLEGLEQGLEQVNIELNKTVEQVGGSGVFDQIGRVFKFAADATGLWENGMVEAVMRNRELRGESEKLTEQLGNFRTSMQHVSFATGRSYEEIHKLAQSLGIDFRGSLESTADGRQKIIDHFRMMDEASKKTGISITELSNTSTEDLAAMVKAADDAAKKASDAFTSSMSLVSGVAGIMAEQKTALEALAEAEIKVAEGGEGAAAAQVAFAEAQGRVAATDLTVFFQNQSQKATEFVNNIQEAARRGLDPQLIQELLQAGPEKAAPFLQSILGDHSGRLIELANETQGKLSQINEQIIGFARATHVAVTTTNREIAAEFGTAMDILRTKAELGAGATAAAIAEKLGLALPDVERIMDHYVITLDSDTLSAKQKADANSAAAAQALEDNAEAGKNAASQRFMDMQKNIAREMDTVQKSVQNNSIASKDILINNSELGKIGASVRFMDMQRAVSGEMGIFRENVGVNSNVAAGALIDNSWRGTSQSGRMFWDFSNDSKANMGSIPPAANESTNSVANHLIDNTWRGVSTTGKMIWDWSRDVYNNLGSVKNALTSPGPGGGPQGTTPGAPTLLAEGSILEFYAKGGFHERHVAQIAPAGTMRLWAEPETGGEAYIPLASSKRGRSVDILAQVADRFGYQLKKFQEGGIWEVPGVPDFNGWWTHPQARENTEYVRALYESWLEDAKNQMRAREAAAARTAPGGVVGGGGAIGEGWRAITDWLDSVGEPYEITSTVRPGSITSSGNLSLHAVGKAVDMVSGDMMRLFNRLLGIGGSLQELFYDPAGFSIKNGGRADFTVGGHDDHVHAATFAQGGYIVDGLSQGITAATPALQMAMQGLANVVSGTVKDALQIHSPSQVFFGYGEEVMQGFILGMESQYEPALTSLDGFAQQISGKLQGIMANTSAQMQAVSAQSTDAALAAVSASQPFGPENISASGGYYAGWTAAAGKGYFTEAELAAGGGYKIVQDNEFIGSGPTSAAQAFLQRLYAEDPGGELARSLSMWFKDQLSTSALGDHWVGIGAIERDRLNEWWSYPSHVGTLPLGANDPIWRAGMPPADSIAWNDYHSPNRGAPGYVQAEDGSWVPESFYGRRSYDRGGWLMPGYTQAYNGANLPERVMTWEQLKALEWVLDHTEAINRGGGGRPHDRHGVLSALDRAAQEVFDALGPNFQGIEGRSPSTKQLMIAFKDLTKQVDELVYGGGMPAPTHPMDASAAVGPVNNTNTINLGGITINESTDARQTGKEVRSQLEELLKQLEVRR